MERSKKDTRKELDEGIYTHIKSIMHSINVDFNYGTPILQR